MQVLYGMHFKQSKIHTQDAEVVKGSQVYSLNDMYFIVCGAVWLLMGPSSPRLKEYIHVAKEKSGKFAYICYIPVNNSCEGIV